MKNFIRYMSLLSAFALLHSCSEKEESAQAPIPTEQTAFQMPTTVDALARMFAVLPIGNAQLWEVYDAVNASSSTGYDEEYTLRNLIEAPGSGVGGTKAIVNGNPLRDLIADYCSRAMPSTKAGAAEVNRYLETLARSDYQIYWPYSENWDGRSMPVVTFDPGFNASANWGYLIGQSEDGLTVVDSLVVTEELAMERPVWVINSNTDEAFTPLTFIVNDAATKAATTTRKLVLKQFTMLRNYDTWFQGASEFFIKCGSVNGFTASTEAELKLYQPSVTDFMVVVPRSKKGVPIDYNAIILTDFTNQLDNLAFLVTEDDGGTRTSWKCSATVKIKSKSYGFDLEIPYNEKDDIVWRGQLSAGFFQAEDEVSGRFGDVMLTFSLE